MAKRKIVLKPHRPEWAAAFEEMRQSIRAACGDVVVEMHHIGSTSIPGIAAKPIIDMLPTVRRCEDGCACVAPLAALGLEYLGAYGIEGRHYFRSTDPPRHHLHMFAADHPEVGRHLRFRDYLRANPEEARAYQALKRSLAAQYVDDVDGYADAKTAFCNRIDTLALGD